MIQRRFHAPEPAPTFAFDEELDGGTQNIPPTTTSASQFLEMYTTMKFSVPSSLKPI
jgi:hypothetical protein